MKTKFNFKKNWKAILAVVLSVVIIATGTVGGFLIFGQPKAKINDTTVMGQGEAEQNGKKLEPRAVISPNVVLFDEGAAEINNAITSVKTTSGGVYLDVAAGTDMDSLGVGDIFFLDGSETTPMGEPYFGKVSSVKTVDGKTSLVLEAPRADEVFDALSFNTENILEDCETATFTALEGVTIVSDAQTIGTSKGVGLPEASTLGEAGKAETITLVNEERKFDVGRKIELSLKLDIFEAYKQCNSDKYEDEPNYSNAATKVYTTPKGCAYHVKDCFHLKASKEVNEVSLATADSEGRSPCKHCKPPALDGRTVKTEPELTLTGSVGLENIKCGIKCNWDILEGKGIEDLSFDISGDFVAKAELKGGMETSIGGADTEIEWESDILDSSLKIQGLKEKVFPIAYYSVTQNIQCTAAGDNNMVRVAVENMPISILIMVYLDVQGNITMGVTANYEYSRHFEYDQDVVTNGQWNLESETKVEEPEITWGLEAGVSGSIDAHVGLSAMVYVFNINIVDVGIVKVGAEAEGKLALSVDNTTIDSSEPWFDASIFARTYVKVLDINLLINVDAELFGGIAGLEAGADFNWTLIDATIAKWGEKLPTRFDKDTMSSSNITAKDATASYYKDEDGRLIMDVNDKKTILYDDEFFTICGIDESYIYFLKTENSSTYDVYRVSKETRAVKEIIGSIDSVLYSDEEHIYYVDGFNKKQIYKFNRFKEERESFATFDHDVEVMTKQGDNFYVTTADNDGMSWFFGASNYYYLIDSAGNIITDYGSNIEVSQYDITDKDKYRVAVNRVSGGVLRGVAREVCWMSKDGSASVVTDGVSGWNFLDDGIITSQNNIGGETPYKMVLYKAEDGSQVTLTETASNQTIFTMQQSGTGDWYYFDQSEQELILYTLDSNFQNKQVVKTFPLDEIKYSLTECGMEILNNCVFFYAISGDDSCEVIKRYDLY